MSTPPPLLLPRVTSAPEPNALSPARYWLLVPATGSSSSSSSSHGSSKSNHRHHGSRRKKHGKKHHRHRHHRHHKREADGEHGLLERHVADASSSPAMAARDVPVVVGASTDDLIKRHDATPRDANELEKRGGTGGAY